MNEMPRFPTEATPADLEERLKDIIIEADGTVGDLLQASRALMMIVEARVGGGLDQHQSGVLTYLVGQVVDRVEDLHAQLLPNGALPWTPAALQKGA